MASKPEKMPAEQSEGGVHLHRTKNNQNAKAVSVALLQARVADAILIEAVYWPSLTLFTSPGQSSMTTRPAVVAITAT